MEAKSYGDKVADIYDDLYPTVPDNMIELLAEAAGPGGRALELGIGSGRVALPLANRGVKVHGVEASSAMVAKLREKTGGESIPVTEGDFADVGAVSGGPFHLVFCTFNTFFALLTQDDQVRCFEGVSSILAEGGAFVLELFVPDLTRFSKYQPVLVTGLREDQVLIEASSHDKLNQRVSSRLVFIAESGIRIVPIEVRYAWPSELDLMARVAKLRLVERWASWDRAPFDARSATHISVYRRSERSVPHCDGTVNTGERTQ